MDSEEAVILLVGSHPVYKARVAEALANGRGASIVEIRKGGARIFRRESSPGAVVVDTTTLENGYKYMQDSARVWVSLNSLRGICGKHVYVVCVLTSSGPMDFIHQKNDFSFNLKYTWLNQLTFTFKEHQQAIMLLVKLDGNDKSEGMKSAIRDLLVRDGFSRSNIIFETLERQDLLPGVKLALEKSLYHSITVGNAKDSDDTLKPFLLKEVGSNAKDVDMYGPWGPEKVFLFGRAGSGKSTLARMLTMGKLDPLDTEFALSGKRGATMDVQSGQGRGWYVVDTPGFGGPEYDSISTTEKKIKNYVQLIDGVYSHFIYVMRKGRVDQLDEKLWLIFSRLFGEDIRHHFTIVISNADRFWVEHNISILQDIFKGCGSFLSAEFPTTARTANQIKRKELQEVRMASLKQLEEELRILKRPFTFCDYGQSSTTNIKSGMASRNEKYVSSTECQRERPRA